MSDLDAIDLAALAGPQARILMYLRRLQTLIEVIGVKVDANTQAIARISETLTAIQEHADKAIEIVDAMRDSLQNVVTADAAQIADLKRQLDAVAQPLAALASQADTIRDHFDQLDTSNDAPTGGPADQPSEPPV